MKAVSACNPASAHVFPSLLSANSTPALSSISETLALLDEPSSAAKTQAIQVLSSVVDYFWPEISQVAAKIETLANDSTSGQAKSASLLLSRLNFHLSKYNDSVAFTLQAGDAFDIEEQSPFAETILAAILDAYSDTRSSGRPALPGIDVLALETIFERVVQRCLREHELKQLVGLALDSRRLDVLETVVQSAKHSEEAASLLVYARQSCDCLINCGEFRHQAIVSIATLARRLPNADFVFLADCYVATNEPEQVAFLINELAARNDSTLVALQIVFNVQCDARQDFLNTVVRRLDANCNPAFTQVLSGNVSSRLHLEFLSRTNHSDSLILERTKTALSPQASLHHQALSCASAFMQAGTTNDDFLRKNLDFFSHATNWAKFSVTAGLGAIHRGQFSKSRDLLSSYLPKDGVTGNEYSESGALFALGLIHAHHGNDIIPYLIEQLQATQSDTLQHGACLGLGTAGISTRDEAAVEAIKAILYSDNAVAGEAAGMALGLVMLGTGDLALVEEMRQYAHETQHEKIIRSLAVGMALVMFGCEEAAEPLIGQLEAEKDPILRYGAVWCTSLAYAGSNSNVAVRRLLHFAVSDANDDVRRAAVTGLGFVLFKTPEELPRLVELLTESYNPAVRYGAALALGIAFAGTANKKALDLIRPMAKDITDYVRQGAFISTAMILMQHNDRSAAHVGTNIVSSFRLQLEQVVGTRHEDALAKFGAILAQGIIDAGGRNSRLTLQTPNGHTSVLQVAGLAVFCQFWYWYPMAHFLPLALTPTALIAVSELSSPSTFSLPKAFSIISQAPASAFAYPEPVKIATAIQPKKLVSAVLSTTAKAAARARRQGKEGVAASAADLLEAQTEKPMEVDVETQKSEEPSAPLPESNFTTVTNMSRVTLSQLALVSFQQDERFQPVSTGVWRGGIVVLRDTTPSEAFECIELSKDEDKEAASNPVTVPAPIIEPTEDMEQ